MRLLESVAEYRAAHVRHNSNGPTHTAVWITVLDPN
jgi:hypothetical protein